MINILRSDPGSQTAAAAEGWAYPFSRVQAQLADQWDLTYAATGTRKPTQYPRPFGRALEKRQRGDASSRTQSEVINILARAKQGDLAPV